MVKGAHSRYFGPVQNYVYIEGNLKIVVHFYCFTIDWFPCECESKSKLLRQINHKGHWQSHEPITKDTDNPVNRSQRTQTIQ